MSLMILTSLIGCESARSVTDTFCLIDEEITVSHQDTQETIDQVVEHNARYYRLCDD